MEFLVNKFNVFLKSVAFRHQAPPLHYPIITLAIPYSISQYSCNTVLSRPNLTLSKPAESPCKAQSEPSCRSGESHPQSHGTSRSCIPSDIAISPNRQSASHLSSEGTIPGNVS